MAEDTSIQQVTGVGGALNAEYYQTYEMAKANDDVLGGDNIAQIRSYAAYARAQAQAIHKTIAATNGLDDVTAIKAEALETEQTFAKVGLYADQRIGEILRELPKAKNQHDSLSSEQDKQTKTEAIHDAGITHSQAYDLQALAANPEVVQAVIDKAEKEGKVASRSQVLQAIRERKLAEQERDNARNELAEAYRTNELLETQVAALNQRVAEQPKPEVVEREVVREVAPDDYEDTKREADGLRRENKRLIKEYNEMREKNQELGRKLEQANELSGERERSASANRDVEQLVNNIYTFLNRHGGKSRAFDQFYRVDATTQEECRKALIALGGFAQSLLSMTEERKMIEA